MRYTVVWSPNAERKLADLWLEAYDRSAVRTDRRTKSMTLCEQIQTRAGNRGRRTVVSADSAARRDLSILSARPDGPRADRLEI